VNGARPKSSFKYLAKWTYADGTSASTPVFAGILTLINQYRLSQGKPQVGFVNPILYKHAATRATFRDITLKGWGGCDPGDGYDLATGIGTPRVPELARAIP
jgi:subtilase family serine protease